MASTLEQLDIFTVLLGIVVTLYLTMLESLHWPIASTSRGGIFSQVGLQENLKHLGVYCVPGTSK